LKTIWEKPSGEGEEVDRLRGNVYCLQYKSRKLKPVANAVPVVGERGIQFAITSEVDEFGQEAKNSPDEGAAFA
jgi:hypothetical protein